MELDTLRFWLPKWVNRSTIYVNHLTLGWTSLRMRLTIGCLSSGTNVLISLRKWIETSMGKFSFEGRENSCLKESLQEFQERFRSIAWRSLYRNPWKDVLRNSRRIFRVNLKILEEFLRKFYWRNSREKHCWKHALKIFLKRLVKTQNF